MKKKADKQTKENQSHEASDSLPRFERLLERASGKEHYSLRLYITGTSVRSNRAVAAIRAVCEEHLKGKYDLEVVDIYQQPVKAVDAQIIAAPTLVKMLPKPLRRFVGNLTNRAKVVSGLDLRDGDLVMDAIA